MKEKITLRYQGGRYVVESLENRIAPPIRTALRPDEVETLLLEAKVKKVLTIKVVG